MRGAGSRPEADPAERVRRSVAEAFRLRWMRRRLLWRALRARHALTPVADRTRTIAPGVVLAFTVVRNEALRLPYFLSHYRALGVGHFLVVDNDNDSDDDTRALLVDQPDVSLWHTTARYRAARFGLDWCGWLRMRHGHGRWCLTVDADELLVYPGCDRTDLPALTRWLDRQGLSGFGALMLDLYPAGPLDAVRYTPGQDPTEVLRHFDAGPYRSVRQRPMGNLWTQGGARERAFFADAPRRSPTLNKIPLMRWNRRHVYVNSTHSALPPRLNALYDGPGGMCPSGVLLHTKFLPDAPARAARERARGEHFHTPEMFADYYVSVEAAPTLHHAGSVRYTGPAQLAALGLATPGGWPGAVPTAAGTDDPDSTPAT
ncbi:hypothetical protein ROJ8625_00578 [Roseivivax jejudonensis]|uniref:Glycosyl transferase family 2 n=1 Tax=Roseivivax jejudonensis TaxID=1529041 RepID=A0A1X6YDJ2_9RHOB|nr:glycosyltransferase family 2 protein [Roseivivax jejudonensis]SLN17813.1 hypothetical protein ROJ8625_00578 [Roseivivax jejudonensis]